MQLNGPDRVAHWDRIGRTIRMGSLDALAVSDETRLCEALEAGDVTAFRAYCSVATPQHSAMVATLLEWCAAYPVTLRATVGQVEEHTLTQEAIGRWRDAVAAESKGRSSEVQEAAECVVRIVAELVAGSLEGCASAASRLNEVPERTLRDCDTAAKRGDWQTARGLLPRYMAETRSRHDFLCLFLWVYPSLVATRCGQQVAEDVMRRGLSSLSFYQPMVALLADLPPEGVVAMLAEHLRGHLSGDRRDGAVQIVEEEDRFRLVFAPCGSGGAMRRSDAARAAMPGLKCYTESTSSTWHLGGQVPAYCAHCAHNELAMIDKVGYPVLVTEFDPDPNRPCGWTVYKDPAAIPDRYFERLGLKKDPSRFVRPPSTEGVTPEATR